MHPYLERIVDKLWEEVPLRASVYFFPTLREVPAEAEFISHQLLLRGGFIRKLSAGVYSFLPLGWRVLRKISQIMREEFDAIGGLEVFLPALHPKELWEETGRWGGAMGEVLFKLRDRSDHWWTLGPTHEEVITDIVRGEVRSYRQLPLLLYQIQTKFRDEPRPRGGLIRAREFIMLDGYSFHRDEESLDKTFKEVWKACERIYRRCGLPVRVVEAWGGAIGGTDTLEFMVLSPSGEDVVLICSSCGYTANVEMAAVGLRSPSETVSSKEKIPPVEKVATPGKRTVEEVSQFLGVQPSCLVKTLIFLADGQPVAALVRGDRELNVGKLQRVLGVEELRMAGPEEIEEITQAPVGFAGPLGLAERGVKIIADYEVSWMTHFVTGANEVDAHFLYVTPGRDFPIHQVADLRNAVEGDPCPRCPGVLKEEHGIEVGHIFKLGTKYSEAMGATFLDEDGKERPFIMGCYGPGVSRTMAAIVEANYDQDGIIWPIEVAPFQVVLLLVNSSDVVQREMADRLYQELLQAGVEVFYDDREERSGVKFKDADLIGYPIQVVVGRRAGEGQVEVRTRKNRETQVVEVSQVVSVVRALINRLKG